MRTVNRIVKIHKTEGFKVFVLFNNGESRVIDFEKLFKLWDIDKGDIEYEISINPQAFQKLQLKEGTLVWEDLKISNIDDEGNPMESYYDIDPIVLFENSKPDEGRQLELGMLIKNARTDLGLTQEELAKKSGTTKHYISKLENNKTGIEVSTLRKIIEGGLGKQMKIEIV